MPFEEAALSVVTVGAGRGFVVRGPYVNLIVTAVECLPFVPTHDSSSVIPDLLARLDAPPFLQADCLFVDVISGITILGPDYPETYFEFVEALVPLEVSEPKDGARAFLLSLSNRWFDGVVNDYDQRLTIHRVEHPFVDGMSGSPILDASGRAIGVVRVSDDTRNTTTGGGPKLATCLPGWFFKKL
jgi:hypothetical protein